ncbi:hypothetical protein HY488_01705 [Candidatus Woesearchaeota archaeon]|nr:hypothetical protein [Candidatus Woesearchaeota archaeon]
MNKQKLQKKGIIGRDWYAIVFSSVVGLSSFILFMTLSYGGQATVILRIEDARLQLEADQELRSMLQAPLFSGIAPPDDTIKSLLQKKTTFAEIIDMIGNDTTYREQYMNILYSQVYHYLDTLGNPERYRLKVSYLQPPSGTFSQPENYARCIDATFCVLANEPQGETMVGEVYYPSIRQGQVITVRLVRAKSAGDSQPSPETPPAVASATTTNGGAG